MFFERHGLKAGQNELEPRVELIFLEGCYEGDNLLGRSVKDEEELIFKHLFCLEAVVESNH